MSSTYKLIYFPIKALAEPLRFLLSYGGLQFEDVRIPKEHWPEIKNEMPFGQVPILEVDGNKAHQSVAIARYLAKKVDLTGENEWEDLQIDAMVDTITDFRLKISSYNIEKDVSKKIKIKEELFTQIIPYYLAKFDNAAKSGYLCLERLTWADLYFVGLLDYCNGVLKYNLIQNYPHLQMVQKNVVSLPTIQTWLIKRPESEY